MSPDELDQYVSQEPMPTLRLTLNSGDQIVIRQQDRPIVSGLTLVLRGLETDRHTLGHRLVSVPNIALVEPILDRPPAGRRRR
jgi:hypothetical protein